MREGMNEIPWNAASLVKEGMRAIVVRQGISDFQRSYASLMREGMNELPLGSSKSGEKAASLVREAMWTGWQGRVNMLVQQHGFTVKAGQSAAAAQQGSTSSPHCEPLESARSTQVSPA